jgi:hypothetical protein
MDLPLRLIDTENYLVQIRNLDEIGRYTVFVKFNEFDILAKPITFDVCLKRNFSKFSGDPLNMVFKNHYSLPALPIFQSDVSKVKVKGLGISKIYCNVRNELSVDCSAAGKWSLQL